jgi:hypothetical protein
MGYSLDPDFNHLFRIAGEFGPESVFEVDCECSSLEEVNMQKFRV